MDVAKRIAELRNEKGWSKNKLSIEAGLSQAYISQLEDGKKHPTVDTVLKICNAIVENVLFRNFFYYSYIIS